MTVGGGQRRQAFIESLCHILRFKLAERVRIFTITAPPAPGIAASAMLEDMTVKTHTVLATVGLPALFIAAPAEAFRCGNKLVREDMHEVQVRRACGEPTTMRYLGTAVRNVAIPVRRKLTRGVSGYRDGYYGYYIEEVVLTEYVYNFGPRKFMRRLLFEGGVLVSIEKIGYGYRD